MKLSIVIATRGHGEIIERLYRNMSRTAENLDEIELILAIDEDDKESYPIDSYSGTGIIPVIFPPHAGMGTYWNGGFKYSTGRYVMFMPDDVIIQTPGWDKAFYDAFAQFPDDIAMVFPNDLIFQDKLCTMPVLSRIACELIAIGDFRYQQYRIDDHIHHTYDILRRIGFDRIAYLPEVIFEHEHYKKVNGQRVYSKAGEDGTQDALLYISLFEKRKEEALKLADYILSQRLSNISDNYQCFVRTP